MIYHGPRLAAQTVFYSDQVEFYLADYRHGKAAYAEPVVFAEPERDGFCCPPTFRLPMESAQDFFEQLWSQGFRSKHDKGGTDRLDAARKEHIDDLRKAAKLSPKE